MNIRKYLLIVFVLWVIFAEMVNITAHAQSAQQWVPDQKVPGYLNDTLTPFLVADQNNGVHAFASQWVDDGNMRRLAVVYRRWSLAGGWTRPVDVLLSPVGRDAEIIGAFLDSKGILHVAFWGGEKNIYYAHVPASDASNVSSWSLPVEVGPEAIGPRSGDIVGDSNGNLVIIYKSKLFGIGVYVVTSSDAGVHWSEPTPIFLINDDQLVPNTIEGYMGSASKVHVVWNTRNLENQYVSLYYVGLDIYSKQWSKPVLLTRKPEVKDFFGPASPFVVDNGKYVVIMYNGGNPFANQPVDYGRPTLLVQTSTDHGASWSDVTTPFPLLTGSSGEHSLVIDSNQNIHALALMRIDSSFNGEYRSVGGMWHSEMKNNVWGNPERFVPFVRALSLRAVVSQGNVLLATWIEEVVGGNGVWYSYRILDSPELPVVAFPTSSAQSSLTPSLSIPAPVATSIQGDKRLLSEQSVTPSSPAQPLILGIIPVVILLLGIIVAVQLRDRHKS